jgi:type IV secretion system protein VirD4
VEEGHAPVLAENGKPIIARLTRCIDGNAGRRLLTDHRQLRAQLAENCLEMLAAEDRSAAAEAEARHRWIAAHQESYL